MRPWGVLVVTLLVCADGHAQSYDELRTEAIGLAQSLVDKVTTAPDANGPAHADVARNIHRLVRCLATGPSDVLYIFPPITRVHIVAIAAALSIDLWSSGCLPQPLSEAFGTLRSRATVSRGGAWVYICVLRAAVYLGVNEIWGRKARAPFRHAVSRVRLAHYAATSNVPEALWLARNWDAALLPIAEWQRLVLDTANIRSEGLVHLAMVHAAIPAYTLLVGSHKRFDLMAYMLSVAQAVDYDQDTNDFMLIAHAGKISSAVCLMTRAFSLPAPLHAIARKMVAMELYEQAEAISAVAIAMEPPEHMTRALHDYLRYGGSLVFVITALHKRNRCAEALVILELLRMTHYQVTGSDIPMFQSATSFLAANVSTTDISRAAAAMLHPYVALAVHSRLGHLAPVPTVDTARPFRGRLLRRLDREWFNADDTVFTSDPMDLLMKQVISNRRVHRKV